MPSSLDKYFKLFTMPSSYTLSGRRMIQVLSRLATAKTSFYFTRLESQNTVAFGSLLELVQ
jgi:hypothetical protein